MQVLPQFSWVNCKHMPIYVLKAINKLSYACTTNFVYKIYKNGYKLIFYGIQRRLIFLCLCSDLRSECLRTRDHMTRILDF